jgi:ketosteroid isomerase-like protein
MTGPRRPSPRGGGLIWVSSRTVLGLERSSPGGGPLVRALAGEFFDPDIEWHDQRELPGATVHHGIEEVGRHLAAAQQALDYEYTDLLELLDAEPRVLAAYRTQARGRASGAPVERDNFYVYTFRRAQITSVEIFGSRREALEAAGLRE